jgi:hypothetical protein
MKLIEMAYAWDRLPNEPAAAYVPFLIYRNLGPGRTLERAYRATKGVRRCRVPGSWQRESVAFQWADRASAWDVDVLTTAGREIVINFIFALERVSRLILQALESGDIRPRTWGQAIRGIKMLGSFVTAEAVVALQQQGSRLSDRR